MTSLPRVRSGLLRHALDKQVLVYDSRDGFVHLLDPATACVMELLEEGVADPGEIVSQVAIRLDVSRNDELLPLALDELRKANMLDLSEAGHSLEPLADVNRRDMIRKLALTGAAALLIPAVATLTASPGYAQGTVPNLGVSRACTASTECISGNCCSGICSDTGCPQAIGAACNSTGQCASGNCCGGVCSATPCVGAIGTRCANDAACTSGRCCNGACAVAACTANGGNCSSPGLNCSCCSGVCNSNGKCTT